MAETVSLRVDIPERLHRRLRVYAARRGDTIKDSVELAVRRLTESVEIAEEQGQ